MAYFSPGMPYFTVTKVEFHLTGGSQHDTLIGAPARNYYIPAKHGHGLQERWTSTWNTTTVPDGTYDLQAVAYDVGGRTGVSTSVPITVKN